MAKKQASSKSKGNKKHRAANTERKRRRRRTRLAAIQVTPTLCTLGNLLAGFTALHFAAKPIDFAGAWGWSSLTIAGALIFLGMLFDAVDGSLARLTHSTSDIGAQLDSLADLVTFGVAPAFMMLRLVSFYIGDAGEHIILGPEADNQFGKVLWGIAAAYVACTALRLARFNVEVPDAAIENHMIFRGLPSPGAAGAVASLIVFHQHWLHVRDLTVDDVTTAVARWTAFGLPFVTLLCALAMVSSVPYVHVINRYVRGNRPFWYVGIMVFAIVLLIIWSQEVLAIAFTAYALSAPIRLLVVRVRRRPATPA